MAHDETGPTGSPSWACHPDSVAPTVLILGGLITAPPMYDGLASRLKARGAAAVVVANVWIPDWLLASVRGAGPITTRSARALLAAGRLAADASDGAPVLVVGHSAGGITARLLTAREPFPGRRFGAAGRIGAIVTLGTPHRLSNGRGAGQRINELAASIADASVPGAFFAPRVGYVSVASRAIRSNPAGSPRERLAHLLYRSVSGRAALPGLEGDGQVPVAAAGLDGARRVVLDRSGHGPGSRPWYGSDGEVDLWWPVALEVWHETLRSRAAELSAESRHAVDGPAAGIAMGQSSIG